MLTKINTIRVDITDIEFLLLVSECDGYLMLQFDVFFKVQVELCSIGKKTNKNPCQCDPSLYTAA